MRGPSNDEYVFDPKNGTYQLFLGNNLLKSIFADFASTEKISFDLTEKTWQPEFKFLLNVDYLGQVVPTIYNTKARDEKLKVSGTIDDLNYNEDTAELNCKIKFNVFDSKDIGIFSWNNDMQFRFSGNVNVTESSLNYLVISTFVADTTITLNPYGHADIQVLQGWVKDSLESVITKYKINLFKSSLKLGDYIKIKSLTEVENKGLLIVGI